MSGLADKYAALAKKAAPGQNARSEVKLPEGGFGAPVPFDQKWCITYLVVEQDQRETRNLGSRGKTGCFHRSGGARCISGATHGGGQRG